MWSDPDRSQLGGLLSLTLRLRLSSRSVLRVSVSEPPAQTRAFRGRPARWGGRSEGNEHMLHLFFWCHVDFSRLYHRANRAMKVQQIHVTQSVCCDFLLHVWLSWFLSESGHLLLLHQWGMDGWISGESISICCGPDCPDDVTEEPAVCVSLY